MGNKDHPKLISFVNTDDTQTNKFKHKMRMVCWELELIITIVWTVHSRVCGREWFIPLCNAVYYSIESYAGFGFRSWQRHFKHTHKVERDEPRSAAEIYALNCRYGRWHQMAMYCPPMFRRICFLYCICDHIFPLVKCSIKFNKACCVHWIHAALTSLW